MPTEWELVRVISAYDGFLDADAIGHGTMANASFFMHYPLAEQYPQAPPPTDVELRESGLLDSDGRPAEGLDFVMFYVGDFDAAAWLYQRMPDLWNDPRRGQVPLSWAISPVLSRRAPMIMDLMWRTRSDQDFFISADNGAGYLSPSMLVEPRPISGLPSGLAEWSKHCTAYYRQWDMRITGFIIDGNAAPTPPAVLDAYSGFSPDGIALQRHDQDFRLQGDLPVIKCGVGHQRD